VIQKHGYEGLALATLIAAAIIIAMGFARLGMLLKFIPYPVTTGFTAGIAVVIISSQIKDFFGLSAEKIPPEFLQKCSLYCQIAHIWNIWAVAISFLTLTLIFTLRRYRPKLPGAIIAIVLTTSITYLFALPVETIEAKFGEIPRSLPAPSFPHFSYDLFKAVFPDAITIALLGAIESLLSAVVAAWNMSEIPHFIEILKGQKGNAAILLITFFLTILIDLTVALQVGVILAAVVFLKRITDKTTVEICQNLAKENDDESIESDDSDILLRNDIPSDVVAFEIQGPFFYSVADLLDEALTQLDFYSSRIYSAFK
jgi:MFS superfamily sulfate permease-like transporter